MPLIIDSSAILSGVPLHGDMVTTPCIQQEFSPGGASWRTFQYLKKAGLKIMTPSAASVKKICETSIQTGDAPRLSEADKEILALAYDMKDTGLLLTDDYSIQNVARRLGIKYSSVTQKGIRRVRRWGYQCSGCGRSSDTGGECLVCGSPMRMVTKK